MATHPTYDNTAIVGVGQSIYTRRPEPGRIAHHFIRDAIVATDYQSIVGPVKWTGQPVKNVTKTPLVAGQWQRKGGNLDLVITANKPAPNIPVGGKTELLS